MPLERTTHFCGMIMHRICKLLGNEDVADENLITIGEVASNHSWGARHAWLRLKGEPLRYHLIIAPEGVPIIINGVSIESHFSMGEPNDQR